MLIYKRDIKRTRKTRRRGSAKHASNIAYVGRVITKSCKDRHKLRHVILYPGFRRPTFPHVFARSRQVRMVVKQRLDLQRLRTDPDAGRREVA